MASGWPRRKWATAATVVLAVAAAAVVAAAAAVAAAVAVALLAAAVVDQQTPFLRSHPAHKRKSPWFGGVTRGTPITDLRTNDTKFQSLCSTSVFILLFLFIDQRYIYILFSWEHLCWIHLNCV